MKKILLLLFGIIIMSNLLWSQEITNVTASQRTDGSKMLDVFYDLSGTEPQYSITLEISFDDGVNYQQVNLVSGDVGTVTPATGLQMLWDAGTEFPEGFYSEAMKVKVSTEAATTWQCGDVLIDSRDEQEYPTVQIGDQCWMAENLNIGTRIDGSNNQINNGTIEKYCFDDDPAMCEAYGGLYEWDEIMQYTTLEGVQGICPEGWHVPTDDEWTLLIDYVVGQGYPNYWNDPNGAGNALKSCRQQNSPLGGDCLTEEHPRWNSDATHAGIDAFGYGSLPGGYRHAYRFFSEVGSHGYWWSSSEIDASYAMIRYQINSSAQLYPDGKYKSFGLSARCLKDIEQTNLPPATPSDPNPEDSATNQPLETTLLWSCSDPENDPLTYDIYFSIENPPTQYLTGQTETTLDPGTLLSNTSYFWKIVAYDDQGNSTHGPVWSFSTECSPQPTIADAGPDQDFECAPEVTLAANTPINGIGTWTIDDAGTWGEFIDIHDPTTTFLGVGGGDYTLKWTIANECGSSEDLVFIYFEPEPTQADAGTDQLNLAGTSATLAANMPDYGSGSWSIASGEGGSFTDDFDPNTTFTGVTGTTYELKWEIMTVCEISEDFVTISFSGSGTFSCGDVLIDSRDGQEYTTVQIGDQCWMAKNLNIGEMITGGTNQTNNGTIERYCYNNDGEWCVEYGGLYQWNEAMQYSTTEGVQGICPENWHLPTDAEWTILTTFLGGEGVAGGKMKETGTTHWASPNTGATNSSGFTGLPGGIRNTNGAFLFLGGGGYFWSSTELSTASAWYRYMFCDNAYVNRSNSNKGYGISVRCLRD